MFFRRRSDPSPVYELTRDRLGRQVDSIDALDIKLGLFFSIGSALIGILAAVIAGRPLKLSHLGAISAVCCGCAYVAIALVASWQLRPRRWSVGPDPKKVLVDYKNEVSTNLMKRRMAETYYRHYRDNEPAYKWKVRAIWFSAIALFAETLFLVGALVLVARAAA